MRQSQVYYRLIFILLTGAGLTYLYSITRPSTIQKQQLELDILIPKQQTYVMSFTDILKVALLANIKTEDFKHVRSKTAVPFEVSVYEAKRDIISKLIIKSGIWEGRITNVYTKAFTNYPESTFIDLGANIGYFSLHAASKGLKTIALEPDWLNLYHFAESVKLNDFGDRITFVRGIVSDERGQDVFLETHGGTKVGSLTAYKTPNKTAAILAGKDVIPTLAVDDVLPLITTSEVIMKADIEGWECRALIGSEQLLVQKKVRYILTEWGYMHTFRNKENTPCTPELMFLAASNLVKAGFVPFNVESKKKLDYTGAGEWKDGNVIWIHEDSQPLWK